MAEEDFSYLFAEFEVAEDDTAAVPTVKLEHEAGPFAVPLTTLAPALGHNGAVLTLDTAQSASFAGEFTLLCPIQEFAQRLFRAGDEAKLCSNRAGAGAQLDQHLYVADVDFSVPRLS